MGITTSDRYATPFCVYVDASKTTQTTMRVMLNRAFKTVTEGVSDDDKAIYRENFSLMLTIICLSVVGSRSVS